MSAILKAEKLQKKFGDFDAVKDISFTVKQGTCVGLLGPNGAGKTTTMRMIMGLCAPTGGSLSLLGLDSAAVTQAERAKIGLVPQEDNLDPDLSVRENLETYGSFFSLPRAFVVEQTDKLLGFMQLTEKQHSRVNQLSGGMKRRLVIARSLIANPDFIILDEPTTGLDPQARVLIWKNLLRLKEEGKTLLLTTHYMDEAQRLCDNIVIVEHGKVLDEGSPEELIQRHVKNYVVDIRKPVPAALNLNDFDYEDIGDSVLVYSNNAKDVTVLLPEDTLYSNRISNLEDVFLRLTGHKLRD